MPYHTTWTPNPKNENLPVLVELPEWASEGLKWGYRQARGTSPEGEYVEFHHCWNCGGWIAAPVYSYRVNDIDTSRLAGREGTEYACARCGEHIGFMGRMS